jgi:16S rRNA (guanine527-N7)-methyltransferase
LGSRCGLERLAEFLGRHGLGPTPGLLAAFERYRQLLLDWNRRVNLTAVTDPAEVETRHFIDSLLCLEIPGFKDLLRTGPTLADVGTGAGFPGVPIRLVFPEVSLWLIESNQKRARFLTALATELGLDRVEVIPRRAEDVGRDRTYREQAGIVTARAVARLPTLAEVTLPLLAPGGRAVYWKGPPDLPDLEPTVPFIRRLGAEPAGTFGPFGAGYGLSRVFIILKKIGPSPEAFPRRPGIPFKRPAVRLK